MKNKWTKWQAIQESPSSSTHNGMFSNSSSTFMFTNEIKHYISMKNIKEGMILSKLHKNRIEAFDRTLGNTNNEHLNWMQRDATHHPKSKGEREGKKRKGKKIEEERKDIMIHFNHMTSHILHN